MGKVLMSGIVTKLTVPTKTIPGIPSSDMAEGSIVKFNENGSPVEYYVAQHDYESGLNGAGRTLYVRKEPCEEEVFWNTTNVNAYSGSNVDTWLNSTYKQKMDSEVQAAVGTTQFYYTPGNGNNTVSVLERSVFLLSSTEIGAKGSANTEGTKIAVSGAMQEHGIITRSPYTGDTQKVVYYISGFGPSLASYISKNAYPICPAFTLPASAVFDEETLLFVGVA